ncbi:hypothetical protein NAL94_23715 (plasmid) [Vibrio alginolyticus]|uniref:hypothetical protein n=1 Tax=Vibrio TaxID=662 RepID=UPI0014839028|nr:MULTISPECIES: hypothetical protein [Vibrio]EGQ7740938.1 hypothetical protein [Vibrio parahaemolyticus]EJG1399039.1 hypothetical protein [Vibrio parahaemolyticus]MDF5393037.1 hypothetical protein [Vibrio parahaemolyticus]MDF5398937.1 hypothetical protein [Vibrio parahaemolyticus]MDW1981944.1 hypothetical protein [Vibrio sp. Vb0304]
MPQQKINNLCDEIECVLRLMARANRSEDDASMEIEAGITLILPLVNELKGELKAV